ncbi:MAG: hypothetical protein C4534_00765 [Gaiellales bacterium]|nr:MAG: hypothetical protein C4534_00765 [Gaiellales bacterium]
MLMDRKKIERWWRWAAIILAGIFLLSFVLLGVGSSSAGNVLQGCNGSSESVNQDSYFVERENYYNGRLADDPNDVEAMIGLARLYAYQTQDRRMEGVALLDRAIAADPANVTARLEKANIYLQLLNDPGEATRLLAEAAAIAPDNAEVFLQLGIAAEQAGQNAQAIDAWNRYLQLDPDSNLADTIRGKIAVLETQPPVAVEAPVATPEEAAPEAPAPAQP